MGQTTAGRSSDSPSRGPTRADPSLAEIYDQDTGNMGWMQEGMKAARKQAATFANYQESRIRHIHQTIDKYLKGML